MKKIIFPVFIFLFLSIFSKAALAREIHSASSAAFAIDTSKSNDNRAAILRRFLKQYNSPLAPFTEDFIESADRYNLDYRLMVAISGVESTFGHQIPTNSYNAWGWGIYGNNVIRFSSWNEAIETISRSLRERYIDKWGGENVYEIGSMYAASPTWASRVVGFMNLIEKYKLTNLKDNLPITI
ncbi:MAG: glucosaminidase domain-containing protein [Candidatus Levybacteria bacterium]|nr:glucosaminidase domain-containing protein [Candidatus Levybacteria bacterium]